MHSPASNRLWLNLTCCFVVVLVVAVGDLLLPCSMLNILQHTQHSCIVYLTNLTRCVELVHQSMCNHGKCSMAKTGFWVHHQTSLHVQTASICTCLQALLCHACEKWLMVCCYKLKKAGIASVTCQSTQDTKLLRWKVMKCS